MILLSSALRAALATEYGLARMMRYGYIRIFSGTQPTDADHNEQGTYLGKITEGGNDFYPGYTSGALDLQAGPVAGACQMRGNWVLTVENTGTAGWWRFIWNGADNVTGSEYVPRVDGLMGEGLILPSNDLTAGDALNIDSFFFFIPPIPT